MPKNYVRTTISIPSDLKERMATVQESVNWSAVAAESFERKLAELIKKRRAESMKDVVNRLRVSKAAANGVQYEDGHRAGTDWAEKHAEVPELRQLERSREEFSRDWDDFFDDADNNSAYAIQELLFFRIHPELDGSREAATEFYGSIVGNDDRLEGAWLKGFAEGALDVWEDVKDQL